MSARRRSRSAVVLAGLVFAGLGAFGARAATIYIGSGGPQGGWGCTSCSGPQAVLPGTVVTLADYNESGPLQLTLGPGTYTITNAATSGYYSAWNYEGYPDSGNWVWSFLIGADNGNGTATVLKDDYIGGVFGTQAGAADATGIVTYDGNAVLSATSTAAFRDTLTLTKTTTLDFFIDDYGLGDNGGGVALHIGAPEPSAWAIMLAGLFGVGAMLRRRRVAAAA